MTKRITAVQDYLRENMLDGVLISSPTLITYLSNFSGFSSIERDGYIFITKSASYILTSALYAEAVKKGVTQLTLYEYTVSISLSEIFQTIVKKHRLKIIGFEPEDLTVSEWNMFKKNIPAELVPIDLSKLRILKEQNEIHEIQKASSIADAALKKIQNRISPGMTERELVFLLESEIRKSVSDVAFPTIVAFGKNAAIPHHKSNDTTLKKNDLILIDFGAVSQEYRSDMTRTFFIGTIPISERKTYEAVFASQQQAVSYITEKLTTNSPIKAQDVDRIARDYLIERGYPSIPHSLGHGIGLAVHESPSLSPRSQEVLSEGMVFSIEPGVYLPGKFGIRIEDLYTIQERKLRQLTPPSHFLQI